jgi:hypothetical protein
MEEGDFYHPDPEINAQVTEEANANERFDVAARLPPRWWICPECGASHTRGFIDGHSSHRCLRCGYGGGGGTFSDLSPKERAMHAAHELRHDCATAD